MNDWWGNDREELVSLMLKDAMTRIAIPLPHQERQSSQCTGKNGFDTYARAERCIRIAARGEVRPYLKQFFSCIITSDSYQSFDSPPSFLTVVPCFQGERQ